MSTYDRVLVIRKSGIYSVIDVPDKLFVDKGMLYCGIADKEDLANIVFSFVYRNEETGQPFIKRCKIEQYIIDKTYTILPEKSTILAFTTGQKDTIKISYKPKPKLKNLTETFKLEEYLVKGIKTGGVRLSIKEVEAVEFVEKQTKRQVNK